MKNKKLLLVAGALVLGAGSLASCGGSGSDLKVWCASEDVPFVEQVVENFKADYSNYADKKIEVIVTNEPDAATALKADATASADVFHFAGDGIGELVRQELLYEFNSSFVNDLGIEPAVLEGGKVNGKQYGIPFTPNTYFMYYDASVYTEEDVKSLSTMLDVDVTSKGYTYNFGLDVANGWYLQSYFFSNGCTIFGENGDDGSAGIQPRDKAEEVAKWVWNYYNGPDKAKLYAGDGSAECGTTIAAVITGTWNSEKIRESIESNGGIYAAAPLPKVDFGSGEVEWKSVGDYKHIGVNAVTKDPELACEFASYLANKDSQALRYEMRKTAPTNLATAQDPSIEWDEAIVAQTKQLENTFKQPSIHSQQGFWNASTAFGSDLQSATELEINDWLDSFLNTITTTAE